MQEDDPLLRAALGDLAPTVDDDGVWNALGAQFARRRYARRRTLKLAGVAAVIVVALGSGAFAAVQWWPHHQPILLINDDPTGVTASPTSQAPTEPAAGWQQLSLPQTGSPYFSYLTMDQTDPDVLYAGTDAGLFVSRDAASSWSRLSAEHVEMLAIDPGPPKAVYGSTLDANGDVRLKKSVDGGATWTQLAASVEHFMGAFWVDTSTSPSTIYVQSLFKPGLLKSTDGGATWEGLGLEGGSELIFPPSGSVLFAHTFEGDPRGFLRSSDGGATWGAIATTLPGVVPNIMRTDPRDPSRRLYLFAVDPNLAPESPADPVVVYVSSDAGETWSQADSSEQTWANMLGSVAPGTPPAAISEAAAFLAALPRTVTDSATGATLDITGGVVIDPSDPSILYAAASTNLGIGGIYKSTDQGATWINTTAAIKTKPFVHAVAVDPQNPETIYVNTWGSVLKSADAGVSWTSVFTDNPGHRLPALSLAVAPSSPSTLYIPTMLKLARSDDGGASWTEMTAAGLWSESTGETGDEPYSRLLVASDSPETLLAFSGSEIYRSSDGGQSWAKAASLPRFDYMLGDGKLTPLKATLGDNLVVAAPGAPSTFYAILSDDSEHFIFGPVGLSRSTDGGQTWTHLGGLKKDDGQFYFPLALDVRDGVTVYARRALFESQAGFAFQNDGIWRSDDGGNTWSQLASEGLPGSQPSAMFVDPWVSGTLYTVGDWSDPEETAATIYRSTDRGDSWQAIGDLPLSDVGGYLTRLVPAPGGVLYAVGPRGVFKWVPDSD
jgi:photosystem II stability/assembly factor-like uncharacterized protein